MKRRKLRKGVFIISLLIIQAVVPVAAYAADFTVGTNITATGNMTVNSGIISGNGSGLTSVTASDLNCSSPPCVSDTEISSLSGAKVTGTVSSATNATNATTATNATNATNAGNADTVDGSHASAFASSGHNHDAVYQQKYANTAVVAQSGGDYTDPVTAMSAIGSWCGTPSSTNPCLLKIMPGVYDIGLNTLNMQNYVDIEGAGENTTFIKGKNSSASAGVVIGASASEIRFLTVENYGGVSDAIAIYNSSVSSLKITTVTIIASGGSNSNYGIYNDTASIILTNVNITVTGSPVNENDGIYSADSSLRIFNLYVTVNGNQLNYGIQSWFSSVIMTDVTVSVSGAATANYGIANYFGGAQIVTVKSFVSGATSVNVGIGTDSTVMRGVYSSASGGQNAIGMGGANNDIQLLTAVASGAPNSLGYNANGSNKIDHSILIGATNTIYNAGTTYVGNSRLEGGTVLNTGTLTCAGVYDENYVFTAGPVCP